MAFRLGKLSLHWRCLYQCVLHLVLSLAPLLIASYHPLSPAKPFSSAQPLDNSFTTATGIPRSVESAIWSYNSATKVLTPTWINDDLSPAKPSFLVYVESAPNALAITGEHLPPSISESPFLA